MRIGIVSDIHGNTAGLSELRRIAEVEADHAAIHDYDVASHAARVAPTGESGAGA